MAKAVIVSAARTAIGTLGGAGPSGAPPSRGSAFGRAGSR